MARVVAAYLWCVAGAACTAAGPGSAPANRPAGGRSAAAASQGRPASMPILHRPQPLCGLGRPNKVRMVYFVPADRQPTRAWRRKIIVVMTFVNDLYRTSLADANLPSRGLDFESDPNGEPAVHLIRGKHPAAHYSGSPKYGFMAQWRSILPEVEAPLGPAGRHLYVIFAETYDHGPAPFEWPGGVALGARFSRNGGVGLFSAWVLQDIFCADTVAGQLALLADETPIRGRKALGCPRGDSPRYEFIEDGFGAVAHELGHALGLWHDHRLDHLYIMGNGFRSLRRNFFSQEPAPGERVRFSLDNARILAFTPFLAEHLDANDTEPPKIELDYPAELPAGAERIEIAAHIRDNGQLRASALFCSAGDSVVWGKLHQGGAKEDDVKVAFPIRPAAKGDIRLHFAAIDAGGNFTQVNANIAVK